MAVASGAMPAADVDELLPWWMNRQTDPTSPDVIIGDGADRNSTHRSWTLLGTVGSPEHGVIDPRGMVTPRPGGFSVDWWVGADDRWHLPSRSAGVRQRLVDESPVVETTMRVPGGEVVHRAWAVAAGDGVPVGGAIVIELRNASAVPVAVAVAIRPFGPDGRSRISRIDLIDSIVTVDGVPAVHLAKLPSRIAVGSNALGDSLAVVESGGAGGHWPAGGVRCGSGRASAALLFPLPHTASIRVLVPLAAPDEGRRRRRVQAPVVVSPAAAPDADRVVAGWEVQTRRSPRIELLERRGPEALRSARRFALLHAAGDDATSWSEGLLGVSESCSLIVALAQHGLHAESARLLMGLDDRIDVGGRFEQEHHRADVGAAWLHAVAEHVRLAGDAVLARTLVGDVAKIAHRVHHDLADGSDRRRSRRSADQVRSGSAESLRVHDLIWAHSGLRSASLVLRIADQVAAADEIARFADALEASVEQALAEAADSTDTALSAVCALVESGSVLAEAGAGHLSRLVPVALDATVNGAVWQRIGSAGMSPRLSAAMACARARIGDDGAVLALRWMLDVGDPTWAWPEFVHPRTGDGCGGDGHAPVATASFLRLVRTLTAVETDDGIDILPVVPRDWLGRSIEVHDLPTRHGRLSFAVRWHGERPAVLWELAGHDDPAVAAASGATPVMLRFRGLDPTWSSSERRGEALLAAPEPAPEPEGAVDLRPAAEVGILPEPDVTGEPAPRAASNPPEPTPEAGSFS